MSTKTKILKIKSEPKVTIKVIPSKKELENLKTVRQFGIDDLQKYKRKIKANIEVFEVAIEKERTEMKRVQSMIDVLEKDIKEANKLKKLAHD